MTFRVGVLSEQPEEFAPLLADDEWQRRHDLVFPLVVRAAAGRSGNRLADLRRRIARQAAINDTSFVAQLAASLLFRRFVEPHVGLEPLEPQENRRDVDIDGVNDPALVDAVRQHRLDVLVVMNCGLLTAATIEAVGVPVVNVHDGDPLVMRGRPPFFWDLLEGRDHTTITVHRVVAAVDAGAVVASCEVSLPSAPSLRSTLRAAELAARPVRLQVLRSALADLAAGSARPAAIEPGPLRTLPTLRDLWVTERRCRRRKPSSQP